jgi:DivIVA domain-containing protein
MARKRKRGQDEPVLGEATAGFGDESATPKRDRLSPVDVQQKVFRLAFRGYNERDVDEFLDQITEDLAALHEENKRLREQLTEGGGSPEGAGAARQQAEVIVRQAREHAARLVEDAERRAASAGPAAAGPPAPSSYLVREREFLQTLASLVQDHARSLKEQAQRVRATAAREAPQPSPAEPPPPAAVVQPEESSPPESEETGRPEGGSPTPGAAAGPPPRAAVVIPPAASETEEESASPVKVETASASTAEGPSEAAADRAEDGDPLLSAWETAFSGEEEPAASRSERGESRRGERDEPSLRELFWGEE